MLLVAVPDPLGASFPDRATGFAPLPMQLLPFPSTVVASQSDPYASFAHDAACALSWGSEFVDLGDKGHINHESGLGSWPVGQAMLAELVGRIEK